MAWCAVSGKAAMFTLRCWIWAVALRWLQLWWLAMGSSPLPLCCLWCLSAPTLTPAAHQDGKNITWCQKEKTGSCQQSQGNCSHSKGGVRPGRWECRDAAMPFWYLVALGWAQLPDEAYVKLGRWHRWGPRGQGLCSQGQGGLEGSGYLHLLIRDMV